jgi:hypothetical protein
MTVPVLDLLDEAVDALMRADAARMTTLASEAEGARQSLAPAEQKAAKAKRQVLARFLELTRRNIHLLNAMNGSARRSKPYGADFH